MEATLEQRYAMKFCFKSGKNATKTFEMMKISYGNKCMHRTNVFRWFKYFKNGRQSVEDEKRARCPRVSRTPDKIEAVRCALKEDCRLTVRMLSARLNIDRETIRTIITENLEKKRFARGLFLTDCRMRRKRIVRHHVQIFFKWPRTTQTS